MATLQKKALKSENKSHKKGYPLIKITRSSVAVQHTVRNVARDFRFRCLHNSKLGSKLVARWRNLFVM